MNTTYLPWGLKVGYWSAYGPTRGVIRSQGNSLLLSTSSLSLSSTPREDVFIDGKGRVGIWTVTPTTNIDVNGEWKFLNSVQIGKPTNESTRCENKDDAGKIVYEIACIASRDTPAFVGCVQTWSVNTVIKRILTVWTPVWTDCTISWWWGMDIIP
jgi:hypothetical protein